MRPIELNQTKQTDLYARACRRMADLSPGWSDEIPSDPAVAVLELASYLSDMQNRKWNQVDASHYLAYLKLLGGTPHRLSPAALLAKPLGAERPYPGQRFWIDGVSYEVTCAGVPGEIRSVQIHCADKQHSWVPGTPSALSENGFSLSMTFTHPIPSGLPVRIWCGLTPEPGRVPPDEHTPPPITLRAQAAGQDGWQDIPLADGTCGLLQSGYWTVTSALPVTALRITAEGVLEGTPCLSELVLEPIQLEQRLTRSACVDLSPPYILPQGWAGYRVLRCFVPAGDFGWREAPELFVQDGSIAGWRGQAPETIRVISAEPDFAYAFSLRPLACEEIHLEEPGVLPESLQLMVQEDGVWYDCAIREPDPSQTLKRGCRWDGERQVLRFGDGRDFCVPAGGALLVAACAVTLGSAGNGAGGVLEQGGVRLLSLAPASGGCDAESAKDAFCRVAREQAEPLRAVTMRDFEALARKTPGLSLGQVQVIPRRTQGKREAGVTVLAKPVSREALPALTPWQTGRLQAWLEQFRLIGVPISVHSPHYLPLSVHVSLRVSAPVAEQEVREAVLRLTDGVTGPLNFGAEISCSAIFAALGALEDVTAVTALELRPLAAGARRAQDGSVRLKPDMLPYLKELRVTQV